MDKPFLIVMLTQNDRTVKDAYSIFDSCRDSKAEYWGLKEESLPQSEMISLYKYMKDCGKKTVLEAVTYTEAEGLECARLAAQAGCDILMGTVFSKDTANFCRQSGIKYMPFAGKVTGRPSVLEGDPREMICRAREYISKGAYGIDLLGYRYTGDAFALCREFVSRVNAPVCIAGSINSYERLEEIKSISPAAFTVGSAFFENRFGSDICSQINAVCDHISGREAVC